MKWVTNISISLPWYTGRISTDKGDNTCQDTIFVLETRFSIHVFIEKNTSNVATGRTGIFAHNCNNKEDISPKFIFLFVKCELNE